LRLKFFSLALLLLFSLKAISSIETPLFLSIDDKNTLGGGIVTALIQDKKGFIWIGTQNGLVRYDGYNFIHHKNDTQNSNSLTGDYVRSLALTTDGKIVIGTLKNGISIYDYTTNNFKNYKHNPDDNTSIINNRIDAIAVDENGGIWLGTNNGLDYLPPKNEGFVHYSHNDNNAQSIINNRIRSLMFDKHGDLWIGSWGGLNKLSFKDKSIKKIFSDNQVKNSLAGKNIKTLVEAANGSIWFGTPEHGGGWIDIESGKINWLPLPQKILNKKSLSNPWITGISQDYMGNIWMGTYGGGLHLIDDETGDIKAIIKHDPALRNGLSSNEIGPLLVDDSGLLWVGTWGSGLNKYNTRNQAFKMLRHSPSQRSLLSYGEVSSIMEAQEGHIWIGTAGNGIDIFDLNYGLIGEYRPNPQDKNTLGDGSISALAQTPQGEIWVGTRQSGIHRFIQSNDNFQRFTAKEGLASNYIHKILPADNDTLWVSTSGGLNLFDIKSQTFSFVATVNEPSTPFTEHVEALVFDSFGNLWIGGESGLYVLIKGEKLLQRFYHDENKQSSLADNDVNSLLIDNKNRLWVATNKDYQRLISWENGQAYFESIGERVKNEKIVMGEKNLVQDKQGNIWTSAFHMIDTTHWKSHTFNISDGVDLGAGWARSFTELTDGKLLFGGSKGIVVVEPNQLKNWNYQPNLAITQVLLDNKNINYSEQLQLSPENKNFSFEFSALDFSEPSKNRYAFKLEPYNKDWTEVTSKYRVATYTNLDPGKYQLKIKGSNRKGEWSSKELSIDIVQQAAWFQTITFKFSIVILLLILIFIAYHLRIKQYHKRQYELQTVKINAELIKKKNELFANVSHEFRTPLTLIIGPLNNILQQIKNRETKQSLQMVLLNAKRLIRMVDQLLDLARLDSVKDEDNGTIDFGLVIKRIHVSFSSLFESKKITSSLKLSEGLVVSIGIDRAEKIIINLVSNAVKYTPAGGNIDILCHHVDGQITFIVKDNGYGIDKKQQQLIFQRFVRANDKNIDHITGAGIGLALVKELVESARGKITVRSEIKKGSEFIVTLPLAEAPLVTDEPQHSKNLDEYSEQNALPILSGEAVVQEVELLLTTEQNFSDKQPQRKSVSDSTELSRQLFTNKPQVLIVEDHKEMQAFIVQCLEQEYDCIVADNGEHGIEIALATIPDLIVTDLMMPRRNGFELARVLRTDMKTSHIPIVMLTAKGDDDSRLEAWKTDIDEYIHKPFNQQELILRVGSLLNIRQLISQRVGGLTHSNIQVGDDSPRTIEATRFVGVSEKDKRFMHQLADLLEKQYHDTELKVTQIFPELAMSERQFHRKMKALLAQTFSDYLRSFRLQKGSEMLLKGGGVTQVALACGFSTANYFSRCFKAQYSLSPKQYVQQNSSTERVKTEHS
jgi:signal transduction histidine kinase/ligand-binding sensor domain-containing protein/DNA-binding response OmpR family regulator